MSSNQGKVKTLKDFLSKYHIERSTYRNANIKWSALKEIQSIYKSIVPELEDTANDIVSRLFKADRVHSIRFRVKDDEHLLEKIVRKKDEKPERVIDKTNFQEEITDLIGIRVLHLYKGDWRVLHQFIIDTYDLHEDPIAYVREGDNTELYDGEDCKSKVHEHNYRSVHYVIETNPTRKTHLAEIQVRTIFEEGWSEVDHDIRYPYNTDNEILNQYLNIFNRISGSADEMGSYIKFLDLAFTSMQVEHKKQLDEKTEKIDELKTEINLLRLSDEEKESLNKKIADLPTIWPNSTLIDPDFFKHSLFQIPVPTLPKFDVDISQLKKLNQRMEDISSFWPETDRIFRFHREQARKLSQGNSEQE